MKSILLPTALLAIVIVSCNNKKPKQISNIDSANLFTTTTKTNIKPNSVRQDSATATGIQSTIGNQSEPVINTNTNTSSLPPTYIPNIITIDKITSDDNFNHLLEVIISNPYDKTMANIQVYLGEDGNVSIPANISETDSQLMNLNVDRIAPHGSKSFTITTKDKGATDRNYTVSARKIRFTDGSMLTP